MSRLQTYYEQLQLPIKTLFLAAVLVAIGSIIANPFLSSILLLDNPLFTTISNICLYSGATILSYFPIYVFIKLIMFRSNDSNAVIVGLLAYATFVIALTLLAPTNLSSAAYASNVTIVLQTANYQVIRTGIFGVSAIYIMLRRVYRTRGNGRVYPLSSFIDKDLVRLIKALIYAIIIAWVFSYIWPIVIDGIYTVVRFITDDVNNPMSLFLYGGFERLLTLTNLSSIVHQELWLGSMGGTYVNSVGQTIVGDATIWMSQIQENVSVLGIGGYGRYSSGYYVLNLFAVPGYVLALSTTISDRKQFQKNIIYMMLGVVLSVLSGMLFPIEIVMLLTSPTLYIIHLFFSSFIYAAISGLSAILGFSYLGVLRAANPGNLLDLIAIARNSVIVNKVQIVLLLGVIMFLIYFVVTRFYFSRMALDILNIGNKRQKVDDFIDGLGGLGNIDTISSTPTRLFVSIQAREKLNVGNLHRQGVTRIVESRKGFILSYGSASFMLQKEINKLLRRYRKALTEA